MSIVREQIKEEIEPIDLRFTEEELDREVDRLVEFVRREVEESGTEGALVALSGGIDSTATANLAVEALGPRRYTASCYRKKSTRRRT